MAFCSVFLLSISDCNLPQRERGRRRASEANTRLERTINHWLEYTQRDLYAWIMPKIAKSKQAKVAFIGDEVTSSRRAFSLIILPLRMFVTNFKSTSVGSGP